MADTDRLTTALAHRYIIERRCGAGDLARTAEWRNGGTAEGGTAEGRNGGTTEGSVNG